MCIRDSLIGEQEKDVIILHHELGIVWASGQREKRGITLVEYGDGKGTTAMSLTVGLPAAIATKMVMDGKISC